MAKVFEVTPEMYERDASRKFRGQMWLLFTLTGVNTTDEHFLPRVAAEMLAKAMGEEPKWLSMGDASDLIDSIKKCDDGSEEKEAAILVAREKLFSLSLDRDACEAAATLPAFMAKEEFGSFWKDAVEAGDKAASGVVSEHKGAGFISIAPGTARFIRFLNESKLTTSAKESGRDSGPAMYFFTGGDGGFEAMKAYADGFCGSIATAGIKYGKAGKVVTAKPFLQKVVN